MAVPMRTSVEPQAIAASISPVIPSTMYQYRGTDFVTV